MTPAPERVQLRRIFRVVNGGTPTSDDRNWDGEVPWATPADLAPLEGRAVTSTARTLTWEGLASGSAAVPAGSILISTRAPIGYVARVVQTTAFNQGCRGLVPTDQIDARYFSYQLMALRPILESRGQGSTFVELSGDALASATLSCFPLHTQRRIADFLDAETARIDALIAKKRRMVELLSERLGAEVDREVHELNVRFGAGQLRHACREITVGIVVTPAKWYADAGVPALRGVNVRPGEVILDDLVRLTPEGHAAHPKSTLVTGDVVVVRTGQAGAAAVIPAALDGANCIDLLIVRAGEGLRPHYLELVLNSSYARDRVELDSVGAIRPFRFHWGERVRMGGAGGR